MESIDWSNLSFGYMPTDYNVLLQMFYQQPKVRA